tara:strand:+ start:1989 stop:2417 length:429 start_codon:yes stop_codon:yes gene_type:complete
LGVIFIPRGVLIKSISLILCIVSFQSFCQTANELSENNKPIVKHAKDLIHTYDREVEKDLIDFKVPILSVHEVVKSAEVFLQSQDIERQMYYRSGVYYDYDYGEWTINYNCHPINGVTPFDCGFRVSIDNTLDLQHKLGYYP